jgi:AcrR family transcriptional regulator
MTSRADPSPPPSATTRPLDVEQIVDAANRIVERDGLAGLSMRKLGAELSVDPMAIYYHVKDKRALLALMTARTIDSMEMPDPAAAWDTRVRHWATAYWEVAATHRDLTLAGLSDPAIGASGLPSTDELIAAISESGLPHDLVQPTAFIIVDAVHGAALGVAAPGRSSDDRAHLRELFEIGLEIIVSGITARAGTQPGGRSAPNR